MCFSERNGKLISTLTALDHEDKRFLGHVFFWTGFRRSGNRRVRVLHCMLIPPVSSLWSSETVVKISQNTGGNTNHVDSTSACLGIWCEDCDLRKLLRSNNLLHEQRDSMLHARKSRLIQLAFEKDLTIKCREEWKDVVLRNFNSA